VASPFPLIGSVCQHVFGKELLGSVPWETTRLAMGLIRMSVTFAATRCEGKFRHLAHRFGRPQKFNEEPTTAEYLICSILVAKRSVQRTFDGVD
jgi:hypothetical protein